MAEDDPRVKNISQWQGQNLLGFTLMLVRAYLKKKVK